jgi:hypothetical protein
MFPRVTNERSIWARGIDRLGEIPFDPTVSHGGDWGFLAMISDTSGQPARGFRGVAEAVRARLQ